METISTALETALQSIATGMDNVIADVTPIALGIVGSVMVITFGVNLFKKVTNKA